MAVWPVRLIAATHDLPLQLEVFVNGQPKNLIGAFTLGQDARIAVRGSELRELGLRVPPDRAADDLIALDEVPGLTYAFAPDTQTIDLFIAPEGLLANYIDASRGAREFAVAETSTGAVVNYSLFGSASSNLDSQVLAFNGVSGMLDGRVFGDYGTLSGSGVARGFGGTDDDVLRLETAWDFEDQQSMTAYRLGDTISGGLVWTRPVRMAGLQVQRDFGLRPDLITMPLPSVSGSAVVPSTVDVYVNNAAVYSGNVPAGPFEISNIPVVSGSGMAQVIVRDATGRESATSAPIHASSLLLKPGLYEYSAEVGVARHRFGLESFAYSDMPMASATARYGLNDLATLEWHGEATSALFNMGVGYVRQWTPWSRASGAISASAHEGDTGVQIYAALEFDGLPFTARASTQRTIGDYSDLGSVTARYERETYATGDFGFYFSDIRPPEAIDQISIGMPLPLGRTQLGLNLTHLERADDPSQYILSGSLSHALADGATLLASGFQDFGETSNLGIYVGLSFSLGANGTATSSIVQDTAGLSYGAEYSKPRGLAPGSLGWQARVVEGASPQHTAAAYYRADHADVQGRILHYGDSVSATADVQGAVVAAGGGVFLTHRVDDAFVVVDAGAPDVDVLYENRRVATTDSSGRALVTGLKSYQTAKVAIDPLNLPVDAQIPKTEADVTPANRGGVALSFNVKTSGGEALLVLRTADGAFVPAGASGKIEGQETEFIVGYDGQAFVGSLAAGNVAIVSFDGTRCRAPFAYTEMPGSQVKIDPVLCQ